MAEFVYPPVVRASFAFFRAMGLQLDVQGAENVPDTGGGVLASTHVSYLDFIFVGLGARPKRLVRFMAKKQVFDHPVSGPLMRGMHHIPVDRKAGAAAFDEALRALKAGELVGVFPEATIDRAFGVKALKTGAARMALETGTPLIPIAIWGTQRLWTKGRPRNFRKRGVPVTIVVGAPIPVLAGDDLARVTARLHVRLREMLTHAQDTYPDAPDGPEDSWWLPSRLGGTAPTVEQARQMDTEDFEKR